LSEFDDLKLGLYRDFIKEDDMVIYDWIMQKQQVPQNYLSLVEEIRLFHKI
jgi:succinate dehydrogenase flavin-adding protein (antitoxin of CptAB toxin-antitoxin module)